MIGQVRGTQRYKPIANHEREELRERIIALATEYGRYVYKTITDMLRLEGWDVGSGKASHSRSGKYTLKMLGLGLIPLGEQADIYASGQYPFVPSGIPEAGQQHLRLIV